MSHYIEAFLSAVPFGLAVLILLTIVWAATKLSPAFGEWMNREDGAKTEAQIAYMNRTGH